MPRQLAVRTGAILLLGFAPATAQGVRSPEAASTRPPTAGIARPPGVGVRLTLDGPVFTDPRGLTLYNGDGGACTDARDAVVVVQSGAGVNWKQPLNLQLPLSCVQKSPPFLAPADARPVGDWSVVERADGARQWAYRQHPLHTSIKDKAPGDANGAYRLRIGSSDGEGRGAAMAPLTGAPPGVTVRLTAAGLVFANQKGKTLYYSDDKGRAEPCRGACLQTWPPLSAPAMATTAGLTADWSIAAAPGGLRQWAFKGRLLHTYAHDDEAHGGQILGDTYGSVFGPAVRGWSIAIAKAAPPPPPGVIVQKLPGGWEQFNSPLPALVYADGRGRPLYTIHCRHGEGARVSCDDVGDDPRYWLSFCGGQSRCAKLWSALPAARDARRSDGLWSVVVIDPAHPFRTVADGRGARVWAYRGHPVFTYAGDRTPGDFYGDDQAFAISGDGMQARPIAAFAREAQARPPVVAMTK